MRGTQPDVGLQLTPSANKAPAKTPTTESLQKSPSSTPAPSKIRAVVPTTTEESPDGSPLDEKLSSWIPRRQAQRFGSPPQALPKPQRQVGGTQVPAR